MSNLYQDAILDAKALRASAIANAKAALEEAFEPKIQEMLRAKLSEEEVAEIAEAEELEEVEHEEGTKKEEVEEAGYAEEAAEINEAELDEILSQLEEMSKHEESLNEAEEGEEEEEEEGEEEEEEVDAAEETEEVGDETKVIDITLGDLKQVIQSLMPGQAMPAAEEPTADSDAEAEVSLEEILDELENEGAESVHDTASVEEGDTGYSHGKQSHTTEEAMKHKKMEETSNLDEMIFGGGEAVLIPTLIGIIGAIITMIGAGVIVHKRQQSKDAMKEQEGEDIKSSLLNLKKSLETGAIKGSDALNKLKGMLDINAVIKGFKSKFPVLGAAASKLFGSTVKEEVGAADQGALLTPEEQAQLAAAVKDAAEEKMNEVDFSDAAVQQAVNDAIGFIKMGGTDMIKNIASMTPAALGLLASAIGGGILSPKIKAKLQPVIDKVKGKIGVTEELEEAKATIETLRKDLQEVNLLNAKYLYMNKLFKSKSLNETQKVKVINALDRATTVTEVKIAYETLKESFETKKQQIKESIGFASKPAGVAPKANIVEADQFISRWQKLAGINK